MAEPRTPRTPRVAETRQNSDGRELRWVQPSTLPSPNPEEGYSYRWIRVSARGELDPTNLSAKLREGWQPVMAADHPELAIEASRGGRAEVGGLVLCKIPTEIVRQRAAYYNNHATRQMESVENNFMRENDPRMPLFTENKRSKVVFGKGPNE